MESPDWAKLPGKVLAGGYEVENCLAAGERSAKFKIRVLGDRFTAAVGEFFAPGTISSAQVDVWLAALLLRHENLSPPLTAGIHEMASLPLPYFVEVQPDETLEDMIRERAATVEEAREVTRAMAEGLTYLHANGFTACHLAPGLIAAIGDRICLRLVQVRQTNTALAPGEDASMDNDVRGLGETIFTILTQTPVGSESPVQPEKLAQPFAFMVARCVEEDPQKRCSLPDVQAMLSGEVRPVKPSSPSKPSSPAKKDSIVRPLEVESPVTRPTESIRIPEAPVAGTVAPVVPKPAAVPPPAPAIAEPVSPVTPVAAGPIGGVPPALGPKPSLPQAVEAPLAGYAGVRRHPREDSKKPESARKRASLLFYIPVGAILVVALLLWVMRPKPHAPAPAVAWPSHEVGPGPGASSTPSPSSASQAPVPAPQAPPPVAAVRNGEKVWRVVAYTFNRHSDAEKRAQAINAKHPALQATVFSPSGGAPYLVALGGAQSREQAEQLRRKARASGLPHDTYIQNYSR